jgi:hypothetical protein
MTIFYKTKLTDKEICKVSDQFGLTAIKKNEKKQTHYMTKKLFCQLNHEYLPLQYFGDDLTKLGKAI